MDSMTSESITFHKYVTVKRLVPSIQVEEEIKCPALTFSATLIFTTMKFSLRHELKK